MFYDGYHFWGMHLIWWLVWVLFLFTIFGWYEPVSKKKVKKDSPLEILQKRFASGHLTTEEYHERKKILESDLQQTPNTSSKWKTNR